VTCNSCPWTSPHIVLSYLNFHSVRSWLGLAQRTFPTTPMSLLTFVHVHRKDSTGRSKPNQPTTSILRRHHTIATVYLYAIYFSLLSLHIYTHARYIQVLYGCCGYRMDFLFKLCICSFFFLSLPFFSMPVQYKRFYQCNSWV